MLANRPAAAFNHWFGPQVALAKSVETPAAPSRFPDPRVCWKSSWAPRRGLAVENPCESRIYASSLPTWNYFSRERARCRHVLMCEAFDLDAQAELSSNYGRGVHHISFDLQDGDVVAYQVGTWECAPGCEVGDGTDARLRFARVVSTQINFSPDCEHGIVQGTALYVEPTWVGHEQERLVLEHHEDDQIQFGPEQVQALWPCSSLEDNWTMEDYNWMITLKPLPPELTEIIERSLQ